MDNTPMMTEGLAMPAEVAASYERAEAAGFAMSCEPFIGRLLSALTASLAPGSTILELGTGLGVGLSWITAGLGSRIDVSVTSVEADPRVAALARQRRWPAYVTIQDGDGLNHLRAAKAASYSLIFADAPAGKWEGLDITISRLAPGGMLIVDDMTPRPEWSSDHVRMTREVREDLLLAKSLLSVELTCGSGAIISTRRHEVQ